MKPYIHATIIFAGFFVAAGTTAIIAAEFQVVSTKGEAVVSMLDGIRTPRRSESIPMVAQRFFIPSDTDPFGNDVAGQLRSEVTPRPSYAPIVDIQAEPATHPERTGRREHTHRVEMKKSAMSAPVAPAAATPAEQATPAANLAAFRVEGLPKKLAPLGKLNIYYRSDSKGGSFGVPGLKVNCNKDVLQFNVDERVMALQQKQIEMQLKSLPKSSTTFVQIGPDGTSRIQEFGANEKFHKDMENAEVARAFEALSTAKKIAVTNAENAMRSAAVDSDSSSDSDSGN